MMFGDASFPVDCPKPPEPVSLHGSHHQLVFQPYVLTKVEKIQTIKPIG
jgi:hypothetical protein